MSAPVTARGASREERAAIALAAGDVEHVATGDERRGEMVAMPVLVPDLAGDAGDEALAGEFEVVVHGEECRHAVTTSSF